MQIVLALRATLRYYSVIEQRNAPEINMQAAVTIGNTTIRQVSKSQVMGVYKATALDAAKKSAGFRLIAIGSRNTIVWADGGSEMVTDAKLAKLQAAHTWSADF